MLKYFGQILFGSDTSGHCNCSQHQYKAPSIPSHRHSCCQSNNAIETISKSKSSHCCCCSVQPHEETGETCSLFNKSTYNEIQEKDNTSSKAEESKNSSTNTLDTSSTIPCGDSPPESTESKPEIEGEDVSAKNDGKSNFIEKEVSVDPNFRLNTLTGMETQVNFIREEIIFPLLNRDLFQSNGLSLLERGIIFQGSSLLSMRNIIMALANELSIHFPQHPCRIIARKATDTFRKYTSENEEYLQAMFEATKEITSNSDLNPVIMFIEDLSSFLSWDDYIKKPDANISKLLASVIDSVFSLTNKNIFFIATIDELHKVPTFLRDVGKFGKVLNFSSSLDDKARRGNIKLLTQKWAREVEEEILNEIVDKTKGFSQEKLQKLCQFTFKEGLKRIWGDVEENSCVKCRSEMKLTESTLSTLKCTAEDWNNALKIILEDDKQHDESRKDSVGVLDSATSSAPLPDEIVDDNLNFSSVGGLDEQIRYLKENVLMPFQEAELLKEWGVEAVKGVIFHGPPGTGKTLLAKAMANELNPTSNPSQKCSFFYRKSTDCFARYVGDSEKILGDLFKAAEKHSPSIIFIDEFDGLCRSRESTTVEFHISMITTLLGLMDSVTRGRVLIIAATNFLASIDPAMRRAGRFDRAIAFPMPDKAGRENILRIHTRNWKNGAEKEILEKMSSATVGYCGADLEQLARQTFFHGIQCKVQNGSASLEITEKNWNFALSQTKSSTPMFTKGIGGNILSQQNLPPGVKLLLQENLSRVEEKLERILQSIQGGLENGNLETFFICGGVEDVNRFLLPLLMNDSKVSSKIAPFALDLDSTTDCKTVMEIELPSIMEGVSSPPEGKIGFLFLQDVDKLILNKSAEMMLNSVIAKLKTLRGQRVVILATAQLSFDAMTERGDEFKEFLGMFQDVQDARSHTYTNPSENELRQFFQKSFKGNFPEDLNHAVKVAQQKDIAFLLQFNAELLKIMNGTNKETLKELIEAYANRKVQRTNHLHLYV